MVDIQCGASKGVSVNQPYDDTHPDPHVHTQAHTQLTHTDTHVHTQANTQLTHRHKRADAHTHTHINMCADTQTHTHTHMCSDTRAHIHTNCRHTNTCAACTHIQTPSCRQTHAQVGAETQ